MQKSFNKMLKGYQSFREKYLQNDSSIMHQLATVGQKPDVMVVACCDSRVDPALILQCDPGDLFIVRNVANIIPPFESDNAHHGTSAALEFGICYLEVEHLIVMGHSQCSGINALLNQDTLVQNDFISNWVTVIPQNNDAEKCDMDSYAKRALRYSYANCLTFPWIKSRVAENKLAIHLWFFDIKTGQIFNYAQDANEFVKLSLNT